MNTYTDRQQVEIFHLLFLAQLGRKLDRRFYALKGGCNLRFFFKSPRYSEDLDLDAQAVPVDKLLDQVRGILESRPFRQILQARGMAIDHVNEQKQTETTQRWKLGLTGPGIEQVLPTKIEFSRRGMHDDAVFEAVDPAIMAAYALQPMLANHYPGEIACRQKLEALITRKETQARDIFDLHLLLAQGVNMGALPPNLCVRLGDARERLDAVGFDVFKSQVLSYFELDDQKPYDSADAWDTIRLNVLEALSGGEP